MRTSAAITIALLCAPSSCLLKRFGAPRGYYSRDGLRPLDEIGAECGVPPPLRAPKWAWKAAWAVGKHALPVLHRWDDCAPSDTNVNLWVCWMKAIVGNSMFGIDDRRLAYDLLPSVTRKVVSRPLASLYPLLHHQNIALRVAYLDRQVRDELAAAADTPTTVVVLGAGFDLRAMRLSDAHETAADADGEATTRPSSTATTRWAEIDLPHVIEQRSRLLGRLARRRPHLAPQLDGLTQLPANLSVAEEARASLRAALRGGGDGVGSSSSAGTANVVFVVEALLIYLPPEDAAALLRLCAEEARAAGARTASLCFADRLPGVEGYDRDAADALLADAGGFRLDAESWLPKPGLARHMGVARLKL